MRRDFFAEFSDNWLGRDYW